MPGSEVPRHVAVIMDGNGRWAQKRRRRRAFGHVSGALRVKSVVRKAGELGIQALTLYVFSSENWSRPESERGVLWKILKKYLVREVDELDRENVRFHVIGETDRLPEDVQNVLDSVKSRLSRNTGLHLTFAISYGSKQELISAAKRFADDCRKGLRSPEDLDQSLMERYLWTSELGELANVDLMIRTSGELRISNFLLWQAAYSELVFTPVCWPDFKPEDLTLAVEEYSSRNRRFGKTGETLCIQN